MAKRVGINGFGRIGRNFFRAFLDKDPGIEIVAVNDLGRARRAGAPAALRLDARPVSDNEVEVADGEIYVDGNDFRVLAERDPAELPWRDIGVDVVVESTGFFTDRDRRLAAPHGRREARSSSRRPRTIPTSRSSSASTTTRTTRSGTTSSRTRPARRTRWRRWRRSCATLRDQARLHDHRPRLYDGAAVQDRLR